MNPLESIYLKNLLINVFHFLRRTPVCPMQLLQYNRNRTSKKGVLLLETHFLEVSQMTTNHPVKQEKNSYRIKYINVLEHFVQKYSKDDLWATEELHLYTKKLLDEGTPYSSHVFNFPKQFKEVISTKFKPFSFFSYRYCLLMDCIFLCAYLISLFK